MTTTDPGTARLSVPAVDALDPIVIGDNDPRIGSVNPHITDLSIHLSPNQDTFLDALVGYSGGLVAMTNTYEGITRTIQGPSSGLTITNPAGVNGNPTFELANDLYAIENLGATGFAIRTGTDTWTTRALVQPTSGFTITDADAVSANPTFTLTGDLNAVEGISTTGLAVRTAADTWETRTLTAPAAGITITNPGGVVGDPTLELANDLGALESISTTGLAVRTAADTWETRTLTAPAAGITITNPSGILGDPTLVLSNDLAQIEGLSSIGFAVRTNNSPEIWATRSIVAASGETTVTNTDGVAANVIIGLPNVGTSVSSSFLKFTTDTKGRISATTAVTPLDITTALAYVPVDVAGSTMTGPLILSGDPIAPLGAATKQYVDNLAAGLDPKGSVKVATTANIALQFNTTIDGIAVTTGDRVLVKNQTDQTENGVYDVLSSGAWTRSFDCNVSTGTLTAGSFFFVEQGTLYAESGWVLTADDPITNASLITFQQFSGAGQIIPGPGMYKDGNTLSVITPNPGNITITGSGIDLTATGVTPGTYKSVTVGLYGRITNGTNPTTIAGYGITDAQPLDSDLTAISAFSGTGFAVRNTGGTWSQRSILGTTNQITVTNGGGDGANPSISFPNVVQFPGTDAVVVPSGTTGQQVTTINGGLRYDSSSNNMRMVENGAWKDIGLVRSISFTNPAEGIALSGSLTGNTFNITTTLSNDLQALEALSSTGIPVRLAGNSWTQRQLSGAAGRIAVTNGDGVAGNPTIDLANSGVTPNTFTKVVVDTYGRVTSGIVAGNAGASTLADYGLTAAAQPLSTNLTNLSAYNTNGMLCYTGTNTFTGRSFVTTGGTTSNNLSITNPQGIAGDITFTTTGDLNAFLASSTATGFPVRTAATTWVQRNIDGTSNRIDVTSGGGIAGNPTIDISATYVGQTSITTLGSISTGTWSATPISPTKGGTGISSNGTIDQFLSVSHTDANVWEYKSLNGTANQVTVTHLAGVTTLSLPQSINTTASVQFSNVSAPVIKSAILTLTDAANIAWNMANGVHATVTLTGNRTIDNPTNLQAGAIVVLRVVQDGTGGRTLSYGTAFKWTGAAAPVVSAGANQVTLVSFLCDGTNLQELSRSLNVG